MRDDRIQARSFGDRPPLHPLLLAFPFTCFLGGLLSDIAYVNSADVMWATFSAWLIAGGLVLGLLPVIAGIVDLVGRRVRGLVALPLAIAMTLALFNAFVHSRDAWTSVVPTGLTLSILTVIVMTFAFVSGSSLVYRRRPVGAFR